MPKKSNSVSIDSGKGLFLSVSICILLIAFSASVSLYVFYQKDSNFRIKIDRFILVIEQKTSINLQRIFHISSRVHPKQETLVARNHYSPQTSVRSRPVIRSSPDQKRIVRLPRRKNKADSKKKVYHWEENGVRHYADSPPEDDALLLSSWEQIESGPNPYARKVSSPKKGKPSPARTSYSATTPTISPKPVTYNTFKKKDADNSFRKMSNGLYEVNGYKIDISAHRTGDILKIRGRISGGESCDAVKVYVSFASRNGRAASAHFTVSNIGPGRSDTLRKDIRVGRGRNGSESYEISNISAYCR